MTPLAAEQGVTGRIPRPGSTPQLGEWIAGATLFALNSRSKSLPNVLREAMKVGVPVIATDCATGRAEMIEDGQSGLRVPVDDIDRLDEGLGRLMSDPAMRDRIGKAATYSIDSIMAHWSQLIDETVTRPNKKD